MLTLVALSTCVPILAGIASVAVRTKRPRLVADTRGVALQTVIVIVVLLAIAGAVAGVLVSRGSETVASLEGQVGTHLTGSLYDTQTKCENAGFVWDADGPDNDAATAADNGCYSF